MIASDGATESSISLGGAWFQLPPEDRPTVGDWVVLDEKRQKITRLLTRKSVFTRLAAGGKADIQLIAANLDTLFIVTSCNEEFNESRLERYLALAKEAGVIPVVILTKTDLVGDSDTFRDRVLAVQADLVVESVDARDATSLARLSTWLGDGSTVALVGSSGVGKSTIVNTLSGAVRMETGAIRQQDAKGRHTTSFRALHLLPEGGILLDVPGMRELGVVELESSLAALFDDIEQLAGLCRFNDCLHQAEPGCAVQRAIHNGELDARRLVNYQKLVDEESRNSLSVAERRSQARQFGKTIRQHVALKRSNKS